MTPSCNPEATTRAALAILKKPDFRRLGKVGQERVEEFYQHKDFIAHHRPFYTGHREVISWEDKKIQD